MRLRSCLLILALCAFGHVAAAKELRETVIALDGQTVVLAQSGKAQFADVWFPDAALADVWLAQHLLQQEMTFTAGETDRYSRTLIGAAAEETMLRDGVAVIFNQQEIPASWHIAEQSARAAKRGVWADDDLVLTYDEAAGHRMEFHLVEGPVTRIYKGRSATYLNFGEDWHSDFSVMIAGRNRRSFEALLSRIQPGTRVRVRGTIFEENGPMIRVTRPEQLELI